MPLRAPYVPVNPPHFASACDKSHCGPRISGLAYSAPNRLEARGRVYAIGRAEVLLTTSVYFGIDCQRCDHRIPLVEVISGPRLYQWFVPRVPPFEVRCESCGVSRIYRSRHVIVFEATTIEDLDTHPAFRDA